MIDQQRKFSTRKFTTLYHLQLKTGLAICKISSAKIMINDSSTKYTCRKNFQLYDILAVTSGINARKRLWNRQAQGAKRLKLTGRKLLTALKLESKKPSLLLKNGCLHGTPLIRTHINKKAAITHLFSLYLICKHSKVSYF